MQHKIPQSACYMSSCRKLIFNGHVIIFQNQFGAKDLTTFNYFNNPTGRAIQTAPVGTESMLAALFIKHKSEKKKKVAVPRLAHICYFFCIARSCARLTRVRVVLC
jgi:hypothetical protein